MVSWVGVIWAAVFVVGNLGWGPLGCWSVGSFVIWVGVIWIAGDLWLLVIGVWGSAGLFVSLGVVGNLLFIIAVQ